MLRPGFDLNKKIIGRGGSCTKGIFIATGAKVRLRGCGSGFLEQSGPRRQTGLQEAPVPLMLAVISEAGDNKNFQRAVGMAVELLRGIGKRFTAFCEREHQRGQQRVPRETSQAAHRAFWVGNISPQGLRCSSVELEGVFLDLPKAGVDSGLEQNSQENASL